MSTARAAAASHPGARARATTRVRPKCPNSLRKPTKTDVAHTLADIAAFLVDNPAVRTLTGSDFYDERIANGLGRIGNFQYELAPDRSCQIGEAVRHLDKGAWSADDAAGVIFVEVGKIIDVELVRL